MPYHERWNSTHWGPDRVRCVDSVNCWVLRLGIYELTGVIQAQKKKRCPRLFLDDYFNQPSQITRGNTCVKPPTSLCNPPISWLVNRGSYNERERGEKTFDHSIKIYKHDQPINHQLTTTIITSMIISHQGHQLPINKPSFNHEFTINNHLPINEPIISPSIDHDLTINQP